jgi:hypothetical protein
MKISGWARKDNSMLLTRMSRRTKFAIALGTITLSVLTAVFVLPVTAQFVGLDLSSTIHTYPWEQQAPVPMKTVGGVANRFDGVDATDNPCTTSTTFVDMPGMTKTFNQGASDQVIVMFTGEWIPSTGRALIRLVVDGVVQPGPGDAASAFVPHEGTVAGTNGFNFLTTALAAGGHTAKIQWSTTGSHVH